MAKILRLNGIKKEIGKLKIIFLRIFRSLEKKILNWVDALFRWKLLLLCIIGLGVILLFTYLLTYLLGISKRTEHIPTYLFFGIVTVLGFLLALRIFFYVRPVLNMDEYVEYLIEVFKNTTPEDDLTILASTPNPGLSEYLLSEKDPKHYYLKYEKILSSCVERDDKNKIKYRILPWGNISNGEVILDDKSDMMRFLEPFMKKLKDENQRNEYKTKLRELMNSNLKSLYPTAHLIESHKGFLAISHPRMGFLGVYDASGGILKIRGAKVAEPVFLDVLREVDSLIK